MKQIIKSGTTSKRLVIFIQKTNTTTGVGLTGVTSASAGLTWYYYRDDQTASTVVSVVAETLGTWTSGGFVEIDATHLPGFYEIGVPNAAIASTNAPTWVYMQLQGAASMVPVNIELELSAFDLTQATQPINVTQWLGTAVTAVTGGVPDVNVKNYNNTAAQTDANNLPKVDLEDIKGVAVSTTSAQLGANVVQFAGAAAVLDANNLPKVDTEDWKGTAVVAPATAGIPDVNTKNYAGIAAAVDVNNLPKVDVEAWKAGLVPVQNVTGVPKVDVVDWLGTAVTAAAGGIPDVNVKNYNNHTALTDANNLPEVDAEDWKGATIVAVSTAGLPKVDVLVNEDKTGYSLTQAFPANFSALAITAGGAITVGTNNDKIGYVLSTGQITIKKNQALSGFTFPMYNTSGVLQTGLTVTAKRSIDGGSIASCTNPAAEIGSGLYTINLAAADLNGGVVTVIFTAPSAFDTTIQLVTQP